jgi:hypothetical protein
MTVDIMQSFLVVPPIAAILRPRGTPRMQENARFDSFPLSHERDLNSFDSPFLKRGIQGDFPKGGYKRSCFCSNIMSILTILR